MFVSEITVIDARCVVKQPKFFKKIEGNCTVKLVYYLFRYYVEVIFCLARLFEMAGS